MNALRLRLAAAGSVAGLLLAACGGGGYDVAGVDRSDAAGVLEGYVRALGEDDAAAACELAAFYAGDGVAEPAGDGSARNDECLADAEALITAAGDAQALEAFREFTVGDDEDDGAEEPHGVDWSGAIASFSPILAAVLGPDAILWNLAAGPDAEPDWRVEYAEYRD